MNTVVKVVKAFNDILKAKYEEHGYDEVSGDYAEVSGDGIYFIEFYLYAGSQFPLDEEAYVDGTYNLSYKNLLQHVILFYNSYISNEFDGDIPSPNYSDEAINELTI